MINGLAPVIIFTFPIVHTPSILSGLPIVGDIVESLFGVPIPIYLSETLTGVFVASEEKSIDMDTQPETSLDGKTKVIQRGVQNTVTVNFVAQKSSIFLSVLLALSDEIFKRAVNGRYRVTYLNGATVVFGGLVHTFSAQEGENDDLVRITMVIQKTNQETKTQSTAFTADNPITQNAGTINGPTP